MNPELSRSVFDRNHFLRSREKRDSRVSAYTTQRHRMNLHPQRSFSNRRSLLVNRRKILTHACSLENGSSNIQVRYVFLGALLSSVSC